MVLFNVKKCHHSAGHQSPKALTMCQIAVGTSDVGPGETDTDNTGYKARSEGSMGCWGHMKNSQPV